MGGSHGCILEGTEGNQSSRTLKGGGDYGKFTTIEGESSEYYRALSEKRGMGEEMRQVNFNVTQSKSSELSPQAINNDRKNE